MKLLERYPLPWRIEFGGNIDEIQGYWLFTIYSSNGEEVMQSVTYSGDGDMIYLSRSEAIEFVEMVNSSGLNGI